MAKNKGRAAPPPPPSGSVKKPTVQAQVDAPPTFKDVLRLLDMLPTRERKLLLATIAADPDAPLHV